MKAYLFFDPGPEREPVDDRNPMDVPDYLDPAALVAHMRARAAEIEAEETVNTRMSAEVINLMAQMERTQRITNLAATSAAQMHPSATLHAQIDRLLDEMAQPGVVSIPRGRPAVSHEMEDD